jgi:hypothetical protein
MMHSSGLITYGISDRRGLPYLWKPEAAERHGSSKQLISAVNSNRDVSAGKEGGLFVTLERNVRELKHIPKSGVNFEWSFVTHKTKQSEGVGAPPLRDPEESRMRPGKQATRVMFGTLNRATEPEERVG